MSKIFTLPDQPEMQVEIIKASKVGLDYKIPSPIVTVRLRYPRCIHSELMTHRVFSRNARSSRAVPVKTMLNEVRTKPFIPWHWGRNQGGMQAGEPFSENEIAEFRAIWLQASMNTIRHTEALMDAEVHKQNPNRLLEPFAWIDTLVTSTEWDNFFWLRDHKDAEPHLQDLARLMREAFNKEQDHSLLFPGEWHLPYITEQDFFQIVIRGTLDETLEKKNLTPTQALKQISAARCARISYKPFDGNASYEREFERFDGLVSSNRIHASPLEHQATPDRWNESIDFWEKPDLHGNFTGWIQWRKTIPNECYGA